MKKRRRRRRKKKQLDPPPCQNQRKAGEYLRYRGKPLRAKILLITLDRGQSVRSQKIFLNRFCVAGARYRASIENSPVIRRCVVNPGSNPRSILSTVHDYWNGMEFEGGEWESGWIDMFFFSFLFITKFELNGRLI